MAGKKNSKTLKVGLRKGGQILKGHSLPTRPTVMMDVIKNQNAFAPDIRKVCDVICADVAMATQILKEANTTLSGLRRRVCSVEQAVFLLGLKHIRQIITRLFLGTALIGKAGLQHQLRSRFLSSARVAAYLAVQLPEISPSFKNDYLTSIAPDEAYTLGLLHDCGISLMVQKFPDYQELYEEAQGSSETSLVFAEDERYKTNHCMVGYLMCEEWQLPRRFCEVILHHHEPIRSANVGKKLEERKAAAMHAILRLTEYLNEDLSPFEWQENRQELLNFFGITDRDVEALKAGAAPLRVQAEADA